MVETLDLLLKIGLGKRTAMNTMANKKVTTNLIAAINEAGVTDGCDPSTGNLIYTVATSFPAKALVHRPKLLEYIVSLKIKTPAQVEAAFCYLCNTCSDHLDIRKFEEACGVGVEVSDEVIECTVDEIFEGKKSEIIEKRYRTNIGSLMAHVRQKQPWADPIKIKRRRVKQIIMYYGAAGAILHNQMKEYCDHKAFLALPPTTIRIPTNEKLFAFPYINPSCFCRDLVIPVECIATVKDLRRTPENYFLASHNLSENVVNASRFGFTQPPYNNMYRPYVPRCRNHVYPRIRSKVGLAAR